MPLDPPTLTLLDVKNHLFAHFLTQSTFHMVNDLKKVKLGAAYDDGDQGVFKAFKEQMFRAALNDLEDTKLVALLDDDTFVLTQPLTTFSQQVTISATTANVMADLLNASARESGVTEYVTNKLGITDSDISTIVSLCMVYRKALDDITNQIDGDGPDEFTPGLGDN